MSKISQIVIYFSIVIFFMAGTNFATDKEKKIKKGSSLSKTNGTPSGIQLNINNISTWFVNNGDSDLSPTGNSGFVFPKGSGKTAMFESGLIWGATVNGERRVGGSTYNHGLLPGRIIGSGVTAVREDETLEHVRIYRVRRNLIDISAEINDGEGSEAEIIAQYEKDWNEWPAQYGAPYEDIDEDGNYNPSVDVPGVKGADQTIWYVANDLDTTVCQGAYGSNPMGIEMQTTVWGYNQSNYMGDVIFRKYKIINKSVDVFDEMYVSMWADPDVGGAGDDYSGCDTTLSLMYSYNSDTYDDMYGDNSPAIGFDFFQGPIVPGEVTDTAIFNNEKRIGYKNLPMTTHYFFINGDAVYADPNLGDYVNGTLQFHNLFRGRISTTGEPFIDPTTGNQAKFTLSGDPVVGTGWVDGMLHPPGDRRQGMVAGPFTMVPSDTQEVVFGEIAAFGENRLDAITKLKQVDYYSQEAYNNLPDFETVPIPPFVEPNFVEENEDVYLKWELSSDIELFDESGYQFQGYNIYQLPEGKKIKTFDKVDGVTTITQLVYDLELGYETMQEVQSGTDSGLEYEFKIEKDYINDSKLLIGKSYYFGVTAYTYTPNDSNKIKTSESRMKIVELVYMDSSEGIKYGDILEVGHLEGGGNASIKVTVIDQTALTGNDYEVFFSQQHYYKDTDGIWKETNYPDSVGQALGKISDVSPSSITGLVFSSSISGTKDLKFAVNVESIDHNYVDGVKLIFPPEIKINSADGDGIVSLIDDATNSVIFGKEVKDSTDLTGDGVFKGGELITVNVNSIELLLNVNYTIYDDGWATLYCQDPAHTAICSSNNITDAVVVNAEGICILEIRGETILFHTEQHWNVKNTTTGQMVLEKQRVFNGIDQYAHYWDTPREVDDEDAPIVDGFRIAVNGSFDAPVGIQSASLNNIDLRLTSSSSQRFSITDYGMQGWAETGKAVDAFGNGTTDMDILQKDYELRFTGEYETPEADSVYKIKDGTGSIATLYGARGYDIKDHPLNPNPNSSEPFLMRIPFEVWNSDDNRQVNLLVYDRKGDPISKPFYGFNPYDRMYCFINNTSYNAEVVNSGDENNSDTDNLTWNLVFWKSDLNTGDIVKINYVNPLVIGVDKFSFNSFTLTSIDDEKLPIEYSLSQNYPNPFNPSTTIQYTLAVSDAINTASTTKIIIYDILGREVVTLVNKVQKAGRYEVQFDANNFSSGVYIYRLQSGSFVKSRKMLLIK
ncbi:MAG: T9SS type A sorting domain-containing protein [Ignavibacteriae bacterium]|nr:T9SS type A sorting domain-containing protein [Ignavibacteriota bacterium]